MFSLGLLGSWGFCLWPCCQPLRVVVLPTKSAIWPYWHPPLHLAVEIQQFKWVQDDKACFFLLSAPNHSPDSFSRYPWIPALPKRVTTISLVFCLHAMHSFIHTYHVPLTFLGKRPKCRNLSSRHLIILVAFSPASSLALQYPFGGVVTGPFSTSVFECWMKFCAFCDLAVMLLYSLDHLQAAHLGHGSRWRVGDNGSRHPIAWNEVWYWLVG